MICYSIGLIQRLCLIYIYWDTLFRDCAKILNFFWVDVSQVHASQYEFLLLCFVYLQIFICEFKEKTRCIFANIRLLVVLLSKSFSMKHKEGTYIISILLFVLTTVLSSQMIDIFLYFMVVIYAF
ncbi:Hypothetical_protein [Hexamita inflata]|uniref:Hypothetical_protein n=1 Tax=Hexamita inflata TaxID=28002 RepID=A0AA86N409_9EUKA|nr:Hypothetical protein HINF_LOCUS25 [Hexamita inflata]